MSSVTCIAFLTVFASILSLLFRLLLILLLLCASVTVTVLALLFLWTAFMQKYARTHVGTAVHTLASVCVSNYDVNTLIVSVLSACCQPMLALCTGSYADTLHLSAR